MTSQMNRLDNQVICRKATSMCNILKEITETDTLEVGKLDFLSVWDILQDIRKVLDCNRMQGYLVKEDSPFLQHAQTNTQALIDAVSRIMGWNIIGYTDKVRLYELARAYRFELGKLGEF